jgi:hypothetical protein
MALVLWVAIQPRGLFESSCRAGDVVERGQP